MNLNTIKSAVMTTAVVLATLWVVRQTAIGKSITDKALK